MSDFLCIPNNGDSYILNKKSISSISIDVYSCHIKIYMKNKTTHKLIYPEGFKENFEHAVSIIQSNLSK